MEKKKSKKKSSCSSDIGEILAQSLTKGQIASLLDVMFAAGDPADYLDSLRESDPDMAQTVERVLKIDPGGALDVAFSRIVSNERILEHWDSLWSCWEDVVFDVGDEKGKYIIQDPHWEPPYFDGYALAEDLDEIAEDMAGLIDKVYDLVKEPALFYSTLEEIDSNIALYPEWMGWSEPCMLGKNATRCVLKWLWLSSHKDQHSGGVFLAKVYELEDKFGMVDLDDEESAAFFAKLPDGVCRQIYECFQNKNQARGRDDIDSRWHKINHVYEQRFDPSKYLKTCWKHLAENWQYGKPLISDAITRGDHQKADSLLAQTFSCYLDRDKKERWHPETSLLLDEQRYYHSDDDGREIAELLELWAGVSENLGNTRRNIASKLQSVICRNPESWDAIICKYKKLRKPEVKEVVDHLFSRWQTEMARRSIHGKINKKILSVTWIHWLIETELDLSRKMEWFLKKLADWLDNLKKDEKSFDQQWRLLARLTKDLPGSRDLQKTYPFFFKIVLPSDSSPSILAKARCGALKKMNAGNCLSQIMDIWKTSLSRLMPDPSNAHKANYDEHAEWMKALYELNQDGYQDVLAEWRKIHKQRRNLWRDMKNHQLPV